MSAEDVIILRKKQRILNIKRQLKTLRERQTLTDYMVQRILDLRKEKLDLECTLESI